MSIRSKLAGMNVHAVQQFVKWTVYTILIVNFFFYLRDDMQAAQHSLGDGASFLDWTAEFATTIDELAWFVLLFLFELETYVLSDEAFEGPMGKLIHGVRLVCYAFLAHTIYAYGGIVLALERALPLAGISDICQLVDQGISYTYNLAYTVVDRANCASLSAGSVFFPVDSEVLVTDADGMAVELRLAWADLIEASVWLLIVFVIELMVRLQGRGVSSGALMTLGNIAKPLLYGVLVVISIFWATLAHWLFVWDEFIWIAGFMAIEMNVAEWRDELQETALAD